jgi:hypothetical protein
VQQFFFRHFCQWDKIVIQGVSLRDNGNYNKSESSVLRICPHYKELLSWRWKGNSAERSYFSMGKHSD